MGNVRPEFVRMLEESFAKTISFEVTLDNPAAFIDADRTLLNLCINVREAMADAGKIITPRIGSPASFCASASWRLRNLSMNGSE
jgi:hypothetical protein